MKTDKKNRKILVIQTAFLGDVVLSTPLIRALRQQFPAAELDVICIPASRSILEQNPHLSRVLSFRKKEGFWRKNYSFWQLILEIRRNGYDIGISLQSSLTSAHLMKWGRIPMRIGFWQQKFLTHPIRHPKGWHMRDRYLALMQPFAPGPFNNQTEVFWDSEAEKTVQQVVGEFRQNSEPVVGMAPGSVWATKCWPEEYWHQLVGELAEAGMRMILLGGPGEVDLCERLRMTGGQFALNLAGQFSITTSAAVIKQVDVMLTNDSAPLHLANAVETDVFAFFGPTVRRFGCYPFRENDRMLEVELECRPCGKHGSNICPQGHLNCMRLISPNSVLSEIMTYLGKKNNAE